MPYQPRAYFPLPCAHCGLVFQAKHLSRKYCSTPCNALATRARKPKRLDEVTAQLAAAQAELARVQAALAALSAPPLAAESAAVLPAAEVPREPPRPQPIAPFKAPVTAQTLLRQVKRYAGSFRGTEVTRPVGPVSLPPTDPHTMLRQHVAGKSLWWRQQLLPGMEDKWLHTKTFWMGTDEHLWLEVSPLFFARVTEVASSLSPLILATLLPDGRGA